MAADIRIVVATLEHVAAMASFVRKADLDEVQASSGLPIDEALRRSLAYSTHAWAGLVDGEVACIFGVSPYSMIDRRGMPWLLGTPLIERHALAFLRRNRRYISIMLRMYNHLENHVDARNTVAVAWLKWLGFTFDEPAPYGKFGLPFMRFEMKV